MAGRGGTVSENAPVPESLQATVTSGISRPQAQPQGSVVLSAEDIDKSSGASTPVGTTKTAPTATQRPPKLPSPRPFFAHFVDHLDRFVVFLETLARRRWDQSVDGSEGIPTSRSEHPLLDEESDKQDQIAVWNTLLELYLSLPTSGTEAQTTAFRAKALRLLRATDLPYDSTHALILCAARNFTSGLVLLWERQGMHEDVLRFWMDRHLDGSISDASAKVVEYLELYGPQGRPQLYPLVLRFLTSNHQLLAKHKMDIAKVLEHIEKEKIMSPVAVVQVLGRNGVASVGLVKQWLMTRIKESREEIQTVCKCLIYPPDALLTDYSCRTSALSNPTV
jgi:vacuolar protein sorting-associated protein 11